MKLTFPLAIRYLLPAFSLFQALNLTLHSNFEISVNKLDNLLILVIIGLLSYLSYKSLIYNTIIIRLQDWLCFKKTNYRKYLQKKYNINKRRIAMDVFIAIRDEHLKEYYNEKQEVIASSIHLFYMNSISIFFVAGYNIYIKQINYFIYFFGASLFFLLIAIIVDRIYEQRELMLLKKIDEKELYNFTNKILDRYITTQETL